MIKRINSLNIKWTLVNLDPSIKIKLNLFSIKDLFKIKIFSFLKFFFLIIIIFFNFKEYLNFLKLKNTKKNKKLFILAGGPSVKKIIDLKKYKLKKNIDFMALGYFKYYRNVKLVPNYQGDNAFLNLNTKNKLLTF